MRQSRFALRRCLPVAGLILLAACSEPGREVDISEVRSRTFPPGTVWPVTVEGPLEIAIQEGSVGAGEISALNFGNIGTDEGTVLVDIRGAVLREAGVTIDQLMQQVTVRAELDGPSEFSGSVNPTYRVARLSLVR